MTDEELVSIVRDQGGVVHKDGNIFIANCNILRDVIFSVIALSITAYAKDDTPVRNEVTGSDT